VVAIGLNIVVDLGDVVVDIDVDIQLLVTIGVAGAFYFDGFRNVCGNLRRDVRGLRWRTRTLRRSSGRL
jgi:hypothetical protein